MARYGQRPENALQRANEFIDVGKPERALETLQEVFRSKKWVYSSSESVLEPIMFKYLELCVDLKKTHIAKEGLFQYRNMFQSVNVGSLETVIRTYLHMAEERTENARLQSTQAVIDIDDLDNLATPESILLSAVSGEDAQDRSDRTILIPWVKFLWESYCQCLELLRTNAYVEHLYHDIARMTFQFCLRYNRKTEFRKLCDKLRKHLADISKLPVQASNVSMSKPETQQLNLETRLYQLDSAIQIELWQEAHRAIEDIHGLMSISKRVPLSKTMANYYQKLAMVFWKMGNHLFHAAALFKHFQLLKEMKKNITQEELQRIASRVLIATLSIPLPSAHPEFDRFVESDKTPLEKAQGLAVLLGLPHPPSRIGLLNDLTRLNVINLATPQLQDLYNWLEVEFDPLLLCSRVQGLIKSLEIEENNLLLQYIPSLQDVTLVHLICQIAQVYQTIEFSKLLELAKFATLFRIERLIVDCVRHNDMQIRINHCQKFISFGIDLSESQREDTPKGPNLQSMPSEQIRNQLVNMSTVLHRAISVVYPANKKDKLQQLRVGLVKHYHDTKAHQRELILKRHQIIEDRKEYIEHLNTVREEEEQRVLVETQRQQALAEQKRLEEERLERERKRALSEIQQIKDRQVKEKIQQISQTSHGQKILKKLDEDDIKKMDADQIAAREAEELQKERRELQAKLKSQEKRIDYLERAKRLEEIPLLEAHVKERENQDESFWNQQEEERIKNAIEERKSMVIHQERLSHLKFEKEVFLSKLFKDRNVVYEDKLKDFDILFVAERKKRLEERRKLRMEEKREKWIKDKQEEEQRKIEEELRREEEEMERIKEVERKEQEEREKIEKEEREKKKLEENERFERTAAKQRQKDLEIEKRLEEEREAAKQKGGSKDGWRSMDAPKRGGDESDSWRRGSAGVSAGKTEEPKKTAEVWRPARVRDAQPSSSWRDGHRDPAKTDDRRDQGRSDDRRDQGRSDDRRDQGRSDDRRDQGRSDDRRDQGRSEGRSEDRRDLTRTDERRSDRYRQEDRREDRNGRDDRDKRDGREDRDRRGEDRDRRGEDRDRRGEDREKRDIRRDDRDVRRELRRDDDRNRDNVWRAKGPDDDARRSGPPRSKEGGDWRRNGSEAAPRRDEKREVKRPPPPVKMDKPRSQDETEDGWSQVARRSGR